MKSFIILLTCLALGGASALARCRHLGRMKPLEMRVSLPAQAKAIQRGAGVVARMLVGTACTSRPAVAITDDARDALMLLDGYHSVAPYELTWAVLIIGGVWLYFKIFKIIASF